MITKAILSIPSFQGDVEINSYCIIERHATELDLWQIIFISLTALKWLGENKLFMIANTIFY